MLTKAQTMHKKLEHDILAVDPKIKCMSSQFREKVESSVTKVVMQILAWTKNRRTTTYHKFTLPEIYFFAMSKRRRKTRRISSRDMTKGRTTRTRGHGRLILCSVDTRAFIKTWEVSTPRSALPNLFEAGKVLDSWHLLQPTLENTDREAVKNDADGAGTDETRT